MLPLLKLSADGKEHSRVEAVKTLAKIFYLSDQDLNELLPSGTQAVFYNRVGWAATYLKKAGLLVSQRRPYFQITSRGLKVSKIDLGYFADE
jgi:restriction system protein